MLQAETAAPATTVFHVTAWKAGSQWVQGVLTVLEPSRILVPPAEFSVGMDESAIEPGRIYSPVYVNRLRFDELPMAAVEHRRFVVIRDLRDTLVSWYFSLLKTHDENPYVAVHREKLVGLDKEMGLLYLLGHQDFYGLAMVASTWMEPADTLMVRFENLIVDPTRWFGLICRECGIEVSEARLQVALEQNSFANLSGRARGTEGAPSHYRKGVAGDWKSHFTPEVAAEFAARFEDLTLKLGYGPTV